MLCLCCNCANISQLLRVHMGMILDQQDLSPLTAMRSVVHSMLMRAFIVKEEYPEYKSQLSRTHANFLAR